MAFIDCTEQQIPRPENKIRKILYYSGKKKKHTAKNLSVHGQQVQIILYKTKHKQVGGKRHDYTIYKKDILLLQKK